MSGSEGVSVQRLARGGAFSLVGSVVGGVAGFAMAAVVTRNTTKDAAGVLFVCISVFLLLFTVVRLGASTGVVYFIARLAALGEDERLRSVLRTGLRPVVIVSSGTAAAVFFAAPQLASLIIPSHPDAATNPLRALTFFLPLAAIADVSVFGARGLRELRPMVLVDRVGRPVGQLLLVCVAVAVGANTATALAFVWAVPYLPAALVAAWWLRVLLKRYEARHGVDRAASGLMRREFWVYTWPRWLQSIAQVVLQRLDVVLIAALVGPSEAAVYAAVTRFLVFGQLTAASIGSVVEPHVSRLVALKDLPAVSTVYQMSTSWLVMVTWPIYMGMLVFSAQLPLVFGQGYDAGTPVIVMLGATMLVATACGLVDVVLSMAGRTLWTLGNATGALIINVGLNLVLIPTLGIMGAAIAWSAAILFKNLVPLVQLHVSLGLSPFGSAARRAAVLVVGTLGVVPGALALTGAPVQVLAVAFGCGLLIYCGLAWVSREELGLDDLLQRRGAATPGTV